MAQELCLRFHVTPPMGCLRVLSATVPYVPAEHEWREITSAHGREGDLVDDQLPVHRRMERTDIPRDAGAARHVAPHLPLHELSRIPVRRAAGGCRVRHDV